MITNRFSKSNPISCAQGRYGEIIVVQGNGIRPARWSGAGEAVDAGMDAPTDAPSITVDNTKRYYIARMDVVKSGAVYYAPPVITLDAVPEPPHGKSAKSKAYLSQASLSEISVTEGGKYYPDVPNVALSDSHGKGAVIEAVLDGAGDRTGASQWEIIQQPNASPSRTPARFAGLDGYFTEIPINGNGTFTAQIVPNPRWFVVRRGGSYRPCTGAADAGRTNKITYTISGYTTGKGASVRLTWRGAEWQNTCAVGLSSESTFLGATSLAAVDAASSGSGYGDKTIKITIDSIYGDEGQIVIEGYTAANPQNTAAPRYAVGSLVLKNGGSGYVVAPQIRFSSNSGFGASATAEVSQGKITKVTLNNSGGGYKTAPTVEAVAGGAEAFAVARPHLRGKYQCHYRFVDATDEKKGGPIPSNLSPVLEVDTDEGAKHLTWTVPAPSGRAAKTELWRTTGDQATMLYRVHSGTQTTFVDDLTDEELRDPDRDGYAAMPIVLPNGDLNANRFVPPPKDKAVVVRFQDRFWYGVDTSGEQPNTVMFSEVDEPESVPEINELIVQSNARSADAITALVPFGNVLLLMQSRHAHSLTFAKQPLLDAQVTPMAYRGAINQRCWDISDGTCYIMDREGVYAMTAGGQIEAMSGPIDNVFREDIDFSKSTWFFLAIEPIHRTLRAFVTLKSDTAAAAPTRALCCDLQSKTWWVESYPLSVRSAVACRMSNGEYRRVYAADGGAVVLDEGHADIARGAIIRVRLTDRGSGYTKPPEVTANGGSGATFRAIVDASGRVSAIHIITTGHNYASGPLQIAGPDAPDGVRAQASFEATSATVDTFMRPTYLFRSKRFRYVTDSDDPQASANTSRSVSVSYSPLRTECNAYLRVFYGSSDAPRNNIVARNRGVGFAARPEDAAWSLNMGRFSPDVSSGSSLALLDGKTLVDVAGADRHVAIELSGAAPGTDHVVIHAIDIDGVANGVAT